MTASKTAAVINTNRCAPGGRTKKSFATGDNVNETDSFSNAVTADEFN
jgi:hypothetical protein